MIKNILRLPQLEINYSADFVPTEYALVLGGREPAAPWLKKVLAERKVWAIDKGANLCLDIDAPPKVLIGDADSADSAAWNWAKEKGATVCRYPWEKDLTDAQLAFSLLEREKNAMAVVTAGFGGRTDHLFSLLFSAASADFPCCVADEREVIFFLKGKGAAHFLCLEKTLALSLLPFSPCVLGVSITNVHWPLEKAELTLATPAAISNFIENGDSFDVAIDDGILGVYLKFFA